MGIFGRFKNYKDKKKAEQDALLEQQVSNEMPAEELSVTDMTFPSPIDKANKTPQTPIQTGELTTAAPKPDLAPKLGTQTYTPPSWVTAGSYEEAVKRTPKLSRADYIHGVSKYRREQGLPDLSLGEVTGMLKGHDPYETEEQRLKREKNLKIASQINAIGTFLNALVNYNRVKGGHVSYTPDKGTETYNRLERIRMGHEQLARSNAKDYLAAIAQDRAERAKQEAAAAAAKQAERNYQMKVNELEWKMNNAKTEAERKKAADELAAQKFAWQKQKDEATLKETQRSNKEREAISRARVYRDDYKVATSAIDSDGNTWTRNTSLSKEEAMRLVMSNDAAKDKSFLDGFRATTTTTNKAGETIRKGDVNWLEAAASLMANKKVPSYVLVEMGYKEGKKDSSKPKAKKVSWHGEASSSQKKTVNFQ